MVEGLVGSSQRSTSRKRLVFSVAVVSLMVVMAVGVAFLGGGPDVTTMGSTDGADGAPPLSERVDPTVVSTGQQLLVFGGSEPAGSRNGNGPGRPLQDGAVYDPRRGGWRKLPAAPLPPLRYRSAVSTGAGVLVVGRPCQEQVVDEFGSVLCAPGGAAAAVYDTGRRGWRKVELPSASWAAPSEEAEGGGIALEGWTGTHAVVAVGHGPGTERWTYEPATSEWEQLPPAPQVGSFAELCADESGVALIGVPDTAGEDGGIDDRTAAATPAVLEASSLVDGEWTDVKRYEAGPSMPLGTEIACGGGNALVFPALPSGVALGRYDLAAQRWHPLPAPPVVLVNSHVTLAENDTFLISSDGGIASFSLSSGQWTIVEEGVSGSSGPAFKVADEVVKLTSEKGKGMMVSRVPGAMTE